MRHPLPIVLALAACAGASGCVTAAVGAVAGLGVAIAQERTLGDAIDDATGAAEVKARLIASDRAGYAEVDVELAQGRLLLSGPVPSSAHRVEAERIAWTVSRVEEVANEITIGPRSGLVRSALDELITAQIRSRLVASSAVRAIDVNIETVQGVVYLMGLARSTAEIEAAAEIASIVPGVQRVVSYMHVRTPAQGMMAQGPQRQAPLADRVQDAYQEAPPVMEGTPMWEEPPAYEVGAARVPGAEEGGPRSLY